MPSAGAGAATSVLSAQEAGPPSSHLPGAGAASSLVLLSAVPQSHGAPTVPFSESRSHVTACLLGVDGLAHGPFQEAHVPVASQELGPRPEARGQARWQAEARSLS